MQRRPGLSGALWLPIIFVLIVGSRPLSMWLSGFVDASGNLSDGTPIDRNFYLVVILVGFYILSRRGFPWSQFIASNKALFFFYGYLLVSILWADSPFSSFKRLFKDFGGVVIALVVLTEAQPFEAVKAIFVRGAYILFPLSYCFLRYFPSLGRVYSRGGELEVTGVTCQKNSLGALIVICGLPLLWDLLEWYRNKVATKDRKQFYGEIGVGLIGAYLLYASNSKTSLVCVIVGVIILAFPFIPRLKNKTRNLALYMPIVAVLSMLLDATTGIKDSALNQLGRDSTYTGRTQVWEFLLNEHTDPIFGTGYYSLWSTPAFRDRIPEWMSNSAHNGYLEAYIEGGYIEIFFLIVMICAVWWKIHRSTSIGDPAALIRLAFFTTFLISNFSESGFARIALPWFSFLLVAVYDIPRSQAVGRAWEQPSIVTLQTQSQRAALT
jgi:exopolysaccharide production protein ExoQ